MQVNNQAISISNNIQNVRPTCCTTKMWVMIINSFVWFFFVPLENFFTHLETSLLPVKGCKILPFLGTAIEQWGFFNVLHLLWHGSILYNGHLRGLVTLTLFAERLETELSIPVLTTWVFPDRGSKSVLLNAFVYIKLK